MSKRPKNWTPDPLKDREAAKEHKGFRVGKKPKVASGKGIITEYPIFDQEFQKIVEGVWQPDGDYYISHDGTKISRTEEPKKNSLEEFTENWYEKNKDSV